MEKLNSVRGVEASQAHGGQPLGAIQSAGTADNIPGSWLARTLASAVVRASGNLPIRVQIGNSPPIAGPGNTIATIRFRDVRALLKLLLYPDLNFGEGYLDGSIEVEGNL